MSSANSPQEGHEIDKRRIGRRIREIRGFDLTQEEFAKIIGVSQSMLSNYENGRVVPPGDVLLRIARQASKSIEWILTGEEGPH